MLRVAVLVVLAAVTAAVAGRRALHIVNLIRAGAPDPERFSDMPKRIRYELVKVIGQKKLLQWTGPGLAHAFTFWGFLVIQLALVESLGGFFDPAFSLPVIGRQAWLGALFDFFVLAVGVSLFAFMVIRLQRDPKIWQRRSRFYGSHTDQALIILLMIFGVIATLLGLNGARHALGQLPYADGAFLARPLGEYMAAKLSHPTLETLEFILLTGHVAIVFSFLILVLHSKHLHVFTSPFNVLFGRHPLALGRLKPLHIDMEAMDENVKIGAGAINDFSWKHHLDMATCTECGRCQSVCPAWNTGKELNPKLVVMNLRDRLFEANGNVDGPVVPDVVSDESLWACVTCGACVYECPVDIEHVDIIVDMRRNQVMMESRFPREAMGMLNNMESSGNPWGMGERERTSWMDGLEGITVLEPGAKLPSGVEYLFFVGCAGSFDDRAKKTTRDVARLLTEAGVSYAVLGPGEPCNGDPARRIGNEFLFQEIAKAAVEVLDNAGVMKIVTQCPHCFNTMRNEYPDYGGRYEVIHHSDLLATLIGEHKLTPRTPLDSNVTYHDPCYLARHNDVVSGPRDVIRATGARQSEMHRCGKKTFCCGAGGARFWMEETEGTRINLERIDEALGQDPDVVATGCPFCLIMLDDAVKDKQMRGEGEGVEVMDIATLLRRSMEAPKAAAEHGHAH